MMNNQEQIEKDFNKLACFVTSEKYIWDHNNHYHRYLLDKIPENCQKALDIGCGNGELCRLLAAKSQKVIGVDMSRNMIENAKRYSNHPNIEFINNDVFMCSFEPDTFDCVVSVAAAHHLPFEKLLQLSKLLLKNGGVLIIIDLYQTRAILDYLIAAVAFPVNFFMNMLKNKRLKRSKEESRYWDEHAKHDVYLTLRNIKTIADCVLPGVLIKRHLFWRYSLVWKKCGSNIG